jgi:hypothetical protein
MDNKQIKEIQKCIVYVFENALLSNTIEWPHVLPPNRQQIYNYICKNPEEVANLKWAYSAYNQIKPFGPLHGTHLQQNIKINFVKWWQHIVDNAIL